MPAVILVPAPFYIFLWRELFARIRLRVKWYRIVVRKRTLTGKDLP
jgi:hypothetical protein